MKLHPIQNSFDSGELSPRMLGRSESNTYQNGLSLCHNMIVDARGPVRSRGGTRFNFEYPIICSRLETFQVNRNTYFNLIFSDQRLDITSLTGTIPKLDLVSNPFFENNGAGWSVVTNGGGSAVDLETGLARLLGGNGGGAYAGVLESVDLSLGENAHTIMVTTFGTGDYEVRIGSAAGLADYFLDTTSDVAYEANFTPGVAGPLTVWIEVRAIQSQLVTITAIHAFDATTGDLALTTVWPCDALDELHFVPLPDGETIYVLHRNYQPHKVVYDITSATFTLVPVTFEDAVAIPPITAPPEWGAGSWPGTGAVFQGRLWLMSTPENPEMIWGSRVGAYEVFFVEDPDTIVDSDAILGVAMEHFGEISWALGTKELIVGTANGEYVITSFTGVITPTDIQLKRQSAYGSAPIQAIQVNDQIMYVSADNRKIRAMRYVDDDSNWSSRDILFIAEHLSKPLIREFAWASNPDNLLWCVLGNGEMISCTYERNNEVQAWHRHTTQGLFLSVAVGEVSGISTLNMLTSRREGFIAYELMINPDISSPVDSALRQEDETPFTVVTGLEHLEGLTVQVIANDAVHPDRIVTGGAITLQREYTNVVVGLGYDKEIITLPLDKGAKTGSAASHMKRFNKIFARVLDSANPIINGDRPPSRSPPTPMNTVQPPRTTDIQVVNLGWSREALIHVKQDLPLHLTLVGLFGELGQENL